MNIDFTTNNIERPYVDWVAIRVGVLDPYEVEDDIKLYDLTVEDVQTMVEPDLDRYLSKYGVNYMADRQEYDLLQAQEERLQNGGLSDDELMNRLEDAMYGYSYSGQNQSFDLDY